MMTYSEINQTYDLNDDNEIRKLETHDALESTWLLRLLKRTSIVIICLASYAIVGFSVYAYSITKSIKTYYDELVPAMTKYAIKEFPSTEFAVGDIVYPFGESWHLLLGFTIKISFDALICIGVFWVFVVLITIPVYKRERKILDVI